MIEKMSVHRALSELKTYNSRINKAIKSSFVQANKKNNNKIDGISIEEFVKKLQGNFDSAKSLIENKKKLKAAIVLSNASTKVTIGNKEYTVAEAIERKQLLVDEKSFLDNLKFQYENQVRFINNKNDKLPQLLEQYLQAVLGEKDKRTVEDIEAHTKNFYSREEYILIDPMNINEYIEELEKDIITFETNVDYVLSESNATTFIEVDLCS